MSDEPRPETSGAVGNDVGIFGSALPAFSLRRRVTVLVSLLAVLVLGGVAATFMPLELVPRGFSNPFLRVAVPWTEAPAPEVVDKVVRPLEEELATVGGLDRMRSFAITGFGQVFLSFKQGTDMDTAYLEVRDRIERARLRLPDDVERVLIRKDDDSGIPIAMYGLTIDPSVTDAHELIENDIATPLRRIDGVANVEVRGQLEKEITIELDRARTESAGLNIYELAQQLSRDNFTLASGFVYAGDRKLHLTSVARYADVAELESRPVAPNVRLGDVATIRYEEPEKLFRVRAMSYPAVALQVFKEGDANTMEVSRRVAAAVDEIGRNPHLGNIGITTLFNQGDVILESLDTLLGSGKIGAIFAVFVLFFFLRRVRMTFIITLSIPLSILVAITVMYFAGETLNIISLLGLMISVGLLVDNSVVVAENVFRLHREGLPRREAVVEGAAEIALAIVMATLTTIIVFLPASLVEGQGQFFLIRLALPISIALAASLVVALVLIPLAIYLTLPSGDGGGAPSPHRLNRIFSRAYDATFERMNDAYGRWLGRALGRRFDAIVVLLLVFAATVAIFKERVEVVDSQEEEARGFEIDVELPESTTMEEAEAFFLEAERLVESKKEAFGLDGWFIFHLATSGEVQGWFTTPKTSDLSPTEMVDILLDELPEKPGVTYYTGEESQEEKDTKGLFTVRLFSEDLGALERAGDDLAARLLQVDGVIGQKKSGDRPGAELGLVVDRERSERLGVNPRVVAGVVGYALRGQALPRFSWGGKEIPVRVRFQESDRERLGQLEDFQVPARDGVVSLRSVTSVAHLPVSPRIVRENRRTARTITLEVAEEQEKEATRRLREVVARYDLPDGVELGSGVGRSAAQEDLQGLLFALGLSIVFIYLLMSFLFESFVLPLSIIFTIPLAFVGVAWAHVLSGLDIDFLGMVGVVLLIGVVVNNGIVLIDYVNRLRHAGQARTEALLLAAHRRFRPIMMTALTTICGMVPLLAGGSNSIGISYTSFALSLVGGLVTATLLTLLVVPVLYTLFDDLRGYLGGVVAWVAGQGRHGKRSTEAPEAG